MTDSQNGYSIPFTAAQKAETIQWISVPGGKLSVRQGAVGVIFKDLAEQFHEHVEHLRWPGCWGGNIRSVRGTTTVWSNHASYSAIDLNAPLHPRYPTRQGSKRYVGFTSAQVAAIRKILTRYSGVIRWGADYVSSTTPFDPMHFEINASPASVIAAAAKLRKIQESENEMSNPWTTVLTESHDGTKATAGSWLVFANLKAGQARDNSALALDAVKDLTAKLTAKGVI